MREWYQEDYARLDRKDKSYKLECSIESCHEPRRYARWYSGGVMDNGLHEQFEYGLCKEHYNATKKWPKGK